MITCGSCEFRNEDDAVFCTSCNSYLPFCGVPSESAPAPAPAPSPVQTATATATATAAEEDRLGAEQPAVVAASAVVEEGTRLAAARGREDLADRLRASGSQLARRVVPVAVVGEFKRGKSTLVNALLQTDVCPVDADVVTAVPTLVRHGDVARAIAYLEAPPDEDPAAPVREPIAEPIELDAIAAYVSERGNPANQRRLRSVEVQLRHRMLKTGLCLVDTPGVGGLDSAHGIFTLATLDLAHALIFVTDASQELTAPELDFLRAAVQRIPVAACVLTKTDLYPAWRRIAALDEGHLRRAGLQVPVIPVSSFLRLRARQDPTLSEESGFRPLVHFLAEAVLGSAGACAAEIAARDVQFVAGELSRQVAAERTVLEQPDRAGAVAEALVADRDRAARLAAPGASWQQMLNDGIQDLVADIEHDLQKRFRTVLREVEGIVDEGDPAASWPDIEVWLSRQLATAAVANRDALTARAVELVDAVAREFDLAGTGVDLGSGRDATRNLAGAELASAASLAGSGNLAPMMLAARMSWLPIAAGSSLGTLLATATPLSVMAVTGVLAPVAIGAAALIGRKLVKDERDRQLDQRRQQAKIATRKYIDEVAFGIGKETRDALRLTQRRLRDEFAARAASIHRSSERALAAARSARDLPPEQRRSRATALHAEEAQLGRVQDRVADLTADPRLAVAGPGGTRG